MFPELFINSIRLKRDKVPSFNEYPFSIPVIKNLEALQFRSNVSFIIGENGSGKSTLLEAIAVAYGFNPEGGTKNFNFNTKNTHSNLYQYVQLVKGTKRPKDGFFFRAESFYNVATNIEELGLVIQNDTFLDIYGGSSLHEMSHGESFFTLFMNRFLGNGLYILDEPEAALSPKRQLSLLTRIRELEKKNSQFIISTQSPIILAYPNSDIIQIDDTLKRIEYTETEHYQIMLNFINNRERMLKILLDT